MNEAEKILHKNSGGLSLYERLTRDRELRKDMLELLSELELVESSVEQFRPTAGSSHEAAKGRGKQVTIRDDVEMTPEPE